MSILKRAHTWEISDSENESDVKLDHSDQDANSSRSAACRSSAEPTDEVKNPERRRRRRTREELQEDTERRKAYREKKREEKEKLKEQKLREQQKRKEAAEKLNLLKPENFIKSLTVRIHTGLLQDAGCDMLLETLDGLALMNRIEDKSLHNSIRWTRKALHATEQADKNGVVEEDQVLMVISQNEFNDMVTSHKKDTDQMALIGEVKEEAESLLQHLSEYLKRMAGKVVTILVTGQHQRGGSWDEDDPHLYHENLEAEELLVHLQLCWNVAVYFMFGWEEVTDHVIAVTKALSKRPYKVLCGDPELGFCMDGSWSGGARVERDGRGLAQVWTRQIQQLKRVSVPTAKSVSTAYPSPSLLMQAYEDLPSEEERRKLLADLTVGSGAKERRVGPDVSGRIYRLLTSQNPQLLLD
ncbi:probable crossover junction endonuclease EME2 [Paramisgurnus dabryanus]|uniref:probable crossover junction endonuclease EME2 n=1 Tax=Paramisgurnus dabryanus TaxID=90735 RepID=UPI0031F3F213